MEHYTNWSLEYIARKAYFDIFCHEFKCIPVEQKLVNLALYIQEGGNLHYAVDAYKDDRSEITLCSLKDTLEYYIEYMRTGKTMSALSYLLH